MLKLKTDMFGV